VAGAPGVAAAFGAATGMVVHTIAATLGLAALFRSAPAVYDAVRLIGAAYLIWLAIGRLRGGERSLANAAVRSGSPRRTYVRALVNNLANPKVIVFYVAFLPQFVAPSAGDPRLQFALLGFVFLAIGLVVDILIGSLAGGVGETLRTRAWVARLIDRVAGCVYAGLGARLALSNR